MARMQLGPGYQAAIYENMPCYEQATTAQCVYQSNAAAINNESQQDAQAQAQQQPANPEVVVSPSPEKEFKYGSEARTQVVVYKPYTINEKGELTPVANAADYSLQLKEKVIQGKVDRACDNAANCPANKGSYPDGMSVTAGKGHSVEKRFTVTSPDGKKSNARIYDTGTKKAYDFVRVDASVKRGFVFNYGNDPN